MGGYTWYLMETLLKMLERLEFDCISAIWVVFREKRKYFWEDILDIGWKPFFFKNARKTGPWLYLGDLNSF